MTLPSSRHITIENKTYSYKICGGKTRYIGQSGPTIELIVELEPNKLLIVDFYSKDWRFDWDAEEQTSHKVAFKPSDVRKTIEAFNSGHDCYLKPEVFSTGVWVLMRKELRIRNKKLTVSSTKPIHLKR